MCLVLATFHMMHTSKISTTTVQNLNGERLSKPTIIYHFSICIIAVGVKSGFWPKIYLSLNGQQALPAGKECRHTSDKNMPQEMSRCGWKALWSGRSPSPLLFYYFIVLLIVSSQFIFQKSNLEAILSNIYSFYHFQVVQRSQGMSFIPWRSHQLTLKSVELPHEPNWLTLLI